MGALRAVRTGVCCMLVAGAAAAGDGWVQHPRLSLDFGLSPVSLSADEADAAAKDDAMIYDTSFAATWALSRTAQLGARAHASRVGDSWAGTRSFGLGAHVDLRTDTAGVWCSAGLGRVQYDVRYVGRMATGDIATTFVAAGADVRFGAFGLEVSYDLYVDEALRFDRFRPAVRWQPAEDVAVLVFASIVNARDEAAFGGEVAWAASGVGVGIRIAESL
jgi:hypothetical protein